jgi:hypothetical protein
MSDASGRTRTDTRRRKPRTATGPLGLAAERVRALAEQLRNQQTTADYLAALQQRRDQLDVIALAAEALVATARVLRSAGAKPPPVATLVPARQGVLELRRRYESDPQAVRQAQARNLDAPIASTNEVFREAWLEVTGPNAGAVALAELLASFPPQFRQARAQIQRICQHLMAAASQLPTSEAELTDVRQKQRELQEKIVELEDMGLDADVQRFLRQCTSAVPLEDLITKPTVLAFLRAHPQLLASLYVSFRRTTAPQVKR